MASLELLAKPSVPAPTVTSLPLLANPTLAVLPGVSVKLPPNVFSEPVVKLMFPPLVRLTSVRQGRLMFALTVIGPVSVLPICNVPTLMVSSAPSSKPRVPTVHPLRPRFIGRPLLRCCSVALLLSPPLGDPIAYSYCVPPSTKMSVVSVTFLLSPNPISAP